MLAIPYADKVDFCFLTPNGINMQVSPSLATFFTILMVYTITASVCLSERLKDIIRILGEYLKSKGTSFQQNESRTVRARGVHTTYCFRDFLF